jgi:predicted ABC-type ATPase
MVVPAGVSPFIIVLAGPNGAGKSTFYELFLDGIPVPFVNADRIAKTLLRDPHSADYEAAKIAEAERQRLVAERQSFVMETVFSDPAGDKVRFLKQARDAGYFVVLVYVGLDHPSLAAARVAHRVRNGGHAVPPDRVAARYDRSLANLGKTLGFVDHAYLYDNSAAPYRRVAETVRGQIVMRAPKPPAWAEGALPKVRRAP